MFSILKASEKDGLKDLYQPREPLSNSSSLHHADSSEDFLCWLATSVTQ